MHARFTNRKDVWLNRLSTRGRRRIACGVACCILGGVVQVSAALAIVVAYGSGGTTAVPPSYAYLPDGITPLNAVALLLVTAGTLSTLCGVAARAAQHRRLAAIREACARNTLF